MPSLMVVDGGCGADLQVCLSVAQGLGAVPAWSGQTCTTGPTPNDSFCVPTLLTADARTVRAGTGNRVRYSSGNDTEKRRSAAKSEKAWASYRRCFREGPPGRELAG